MDCSLQKQQTVKSSVDTHVSVLSLGASSLFLTLAVPAAESEEVSTGWPTLVNGGESGVPQP